MLLRSTTQVLLQELSEEEDSPEYISVQRVECLAEIHRYYQRQTPEIAQIEDTECQDAICGRLLVCETRMLRALMSWQLSAFSVERNLCPYLARREK